MRGSRRTGLAIFHPTMTAGVLRAAAEQYRRQPMYSALGRRLLLKVGTDSEDPRISANWPCGPVVRPAPFLLHHQKAHSLFGATEKRMGVLKPPGFPGTPVPRDGRTPQRKNAGPVLTEELPRAPRSWRNGQKKSAAIPRANGTAAVREGAAFPGAAPGKQADSGDRGGNRGQEGSVRGAEIPPAAASEPFPAWEMGELRLSSPASPASRPSSAAPPPAGSPSCPWRWCRTGSAGRSGWEWPSGR